MRTTTGLAARIAAVTLSAAAASHSARPTDDRAEQSFDAARTHLDGGLLDEAEREILRGLSYDPYEARGMRLSMELAKRRGDRAALLKWGKWLFWSLRSAGEDRAAGEVAATLTEAYPGWNADEAHVAAWSELTAKTAKKAAGNKHGRVAAYLLRKLVDLNPADDSARKQFEKVVKKFGGGVLGEGFSAGAGHSAEWLERQNRAHEEWKRAFEGKTKHYKITTNVSYELFEMLKETMDDLWAHYEEVLGFRGKAPTLDVAVHRDEDEFISWCSKRLGYRVSSSTTFFTHDSMLLAACDWTEGLAPSFVLESIFEVASYQPLYLMTKKKAGESPPAWLWRGVPSYFRGCRPGADGTILKNLPNDFQLSSWQRLEAQDYDRSLEDVIKCSMDSLDGTYRPYAWALVYFLNNYEDENGDRIYRQPFLEYLTSYAKRSGMDDRERAQEAFDRARVMFVDDVADPDVPDWTAFEERWRAFTLEIVRRDQGGAEVADELLADGRTYLERGEFERTYLMARWADEKRPRHAETYRLLARANLGLEREDDAAYWMLRNWERCLELEADEERDRAEAWLVESGFDYLAEGYCGATRSTITAIEGAMDEAIAEEAPGAAMLFAAHALQAFRTDVKSLLLLVDDVRRELASVDTRLWRRAFVKGSAFNRTWGGTDVVKYDPESVLVNNPTEYGRPEALCDRPGLSRLVPPYDIRGKIQIEGDYGAYLDLGAPPGGWRRAALRFQPDGSILAYNIGTQYDEDGRAQVDYTPVASWKVPASDTWAFELSVAGEGGGELRLGDKTFQLPKEWTADRLTGRFAVAAGDGAVALFQGIEVRPGKPFWPVTLVGGP